MMIDRCNIDQYVERFFAGDTTAAEEEAMAETIAKVLYPEDNDYEGKSLRLKRQ